MRVTGILLPVGFGWLAGMRSLAGPTFASYRLRRRPRSSAAAVGEVLAWRSSPVVLSALALGEVGFDKWTGAPDRTAPLSLAGRALLGAVAGAAVSDPIRAGARDRSAALGALLGAVAAVASTYTSLWLRRRAAEATGISSRRLGFVEDALTVALGTTLARA